MILNCRICSKEFRSLVIPQERCLQELVNEVATHCAQKHKKVVEKFNEDMVRIGALSMGLAMLHKVVDVPVTETFVQESIERDVKKLMEVLGYVQQADNENKPNASSNLPQFPSSERAPADRL